MPFAFIISGIVLLVAAVRDRVTNGNPNLVELLKGDFTGQNNFLYWLISILVVGALGYIPELRKLSRAFLALLIVVLFLSNGGFFNEFQQQVFGASANTSTGSVTV